MRIIHFSCVAPPETGGIGRIAAKEVASLAESGHEAHLISLTTHAGFRIGNVGTIHALEHFVRETDVVHLHYPFYGVAGALARLRRTGKIARLVMTLHMDATAPGWRNIAANIHRRYFQTGILNTADALLVSSRDYAEHSSFRSVADRVIELPFGIDETLFSPGSSERARFRLPDYASVALFVGGMDKPHEFKGVPVLLEAAARVPDLHLLLVGDGSLRASYEARAKKLGIEARCHFVGKLNDTDLVAAYRSADVTVLPSTSGAEAFGIVLLESQACGTPVVASGLPGVRTVVDDGKTGLLVASGDVSALVGALRRCMTDAPLLQQAKAASRPWILEKFTWGKHMEGLEAVYDQLVALPVPARPCPSGRRAAGGRQAGRSS